MSDSSDTSISPIIHKGKRKATVLTDSNEESDSSSASDLEVTVVRRNGKRKARIRESESESDSSIDKLRKIKRVPRVTSDSESSCSSDESVILRSRTKKPARVVSDNSNESVSDSDGSGVTDNGFEDNTSDEWESDWISESEIEPQVAEKTDSPAKPAGTTSTLAHLGNISDSSDGETEKCPICLLSFNQQEVGTPETCDHSFCAECIQEWSKNVNTCPVDRQTFTLILVRKRYNGKVIRRVPVDVRRPSVDELIQEDPTYCEICGMSDREDRLLLCDGCDLGYHLECLDPPLDTVPVEEWFCSICRGSGFNQGNQQEIRNNQQSRRNHRVETRLLPRTSQSERIRATIETNRHNLNFHVDQQSLSSGFEDLSVPGTSRNSSNSATRSRSRNIGPTINRKKKKSSRRKKRKTRRTRYSITYEICDKTGEKIAIKTKLKTKRRRKYKRRSTRRTVKPKTVKKRLAFQLGMCPPKKAGLAVPEVKVKSNASNSGNIGYQRSQAGIPTLHLFGQRDQLDYFSESDDEIATMATTAGAGNAILTQTRSDANSIISLRRAARRKAAVLSPVPPSSVNSCDILGSILDSQAKLHSKHSVISVSRDGTLRIENDKLSKSEKNNNIIKSDTNEVINDNPPLDITSRNNEIETTQAPMFPGRGSGNRQSYGFNRGGYRGNDNRYDNHSGSGYNNFQSGGNRGRGGGYGFGHNQRDNYSGGSNYMNYHHHTGPSPPFRGRGGVRFPMRRPNFEQHQQQSNQITENEPVDLVLDDPVEQNPDQNDISTSQEHEEDIDIYSDIEDNTQTHEEEDVHIKPPSVEPHTVPGLVSQAYNNSDDDDSGSELVIDDTKETDKYDPTQPSADTDSNSESGANLKEKITPEDNSPIEEVQKLNVSENTDVKSQESENLIDKPEEEEQIPTTTASTLSNPISQQVVKQVVQEVIQEHLNIPSKSNTTCDDNDSSDEDCPNFSIYSSTSIDIAKATDYSADIPISNSKTDEIESNMSKQEPEQLEDDSELVQQTLDNTENENIDNKVIESEQNTTTQDNYDASDDWDACDAENAQKSWEESYQPPVEAKTNESEKIPELDKETNEDNLPSEEKADVIDIEDERSVHSESNDQDNKIIELDDETDVNSPNDEEKIETIDITDDPDEAQLEKDNNYDDSDKSPKPDTISISVESEQSMIVESLTPPLPPFSIPMPAEPSPQKPSPIKIAFNPNTRKIQKTDPDNKKEKVFQLYDDSDYEEWELKNMDKPTKDDESSASNVNDLEKMTEAISEEERSYTPCLDEKDPTKVHYTEEDKNIGAGIGGMDTEMISDEERNDFDESHDMKTISDGDALEINAKESELELARPEDYEEGEIVEKSGTKVPPETPVEKTPKVSTFEEDKKKRSKKKPEKEVEKDKQKENEKNNKKSEFKKISKSNKERNYREKERSRSKEQNKGKENKENRKEDLRKKKERKRDLERYNVRSMIAEKPKKDQFGRDIKSPSRSSRSASPRRSRSHSWNRSRKRRRRSRSPRRSRSRSHSPRSRSRGRSPRRSRSFRRSKSPRRSRSRSLRRSRTPRNKRHRNEFRSLSRDRERVRYRNRSRRSLERDRPKRTKKNRSVSRTRIRSRTPSPGKHRIRPEWTREGDAVAHHSYTREWTPSWSRSPTPPRPIPRHNLPQSMSPSWTPPLAIDKGTVQPENLTVILNNDVNKTKKKEKRKKTDKKSRDEYRKRKRVDRTPPPSKEVFASGDNILVSVSFNKTNEENPVQREVMGVKRKRENEVVKKKKEKNGEKKKKRAKSPRTKKKNKEIANLKPVAIIDLDRSPFKELTPSPKDIIVLSDSDNCEKEDESMMVHHHEMLQEELMSLGAQNQEDSAPQSPNNYLNSTGPKTPPEPQIKFLLTSKQSQLRAINNPLHDPNDEADQEIDPQEELEHRLDDILHKGPNTPPEPPSSPPSSPDAYDPFDPTKSRSPTPEPADTSQPIITTPGDTKESDCDLVDLAVGPLESSQKSTNTLNDSSENRSGSLDRSKRLSISPERTSQTRTPPTVGSEQTSESNDNKTESTEKITKSPERNPIGVLINQQVQLPAVVKPIISTSAVITSAPAASNTSLPRTNLFNTSTSVSGTPRIATSVPQRIILPTPAKASPSKMSPLKTSPSKPPIKSTPIKPMPSKTMISKLPVPNMKPLTPIRKGAPTKPVNRSVGQNGNEVIDVDLDFDSPYSPGSSDYEDLFEPPAESTKATTRQKNTKSPAKQNAFDNLFGSSPVFRTNKTKSKSNAAKVPVKMNKKSANSKSATKTVGVKIDEDNLKILDDLPNSAVEMQVKDKFLKKLNRQERVVEEVKLVLKPHYNKKHVTKEQYKDILRRAVPKICHNRSGEINPKKIQNLIEAYVKKVRHARKAAATTNQNTTNVATQQAKPAKTSFWS